MLDDVRKQSQDVLEWADTGAMSYNVVLDEIKEDVRVKVDTLINPRTVSKRLDPYGRNVLASQIVEGRKNRRSLDQRLSDRESEHARQNVEMDGMRQVRYKQESALRKRKWKILVRLKELLRIGDSTSRKLEKKIMDMAVSMDNIWSESRAVQTEIGRLKMVWKNIPDPKDLLEAYYEKIGNIPLSQEEKWELLKPEILSELSTDEYIALWRRLNPHFLSHVTRQGFRDHNAMVYHSGGMEEFHDGLTNVLEDGKILRSPMAVRMGLRGIDDTSVKMFLDTWALQAENEEEAKYRLDRQLNHTLASAPAYSDRTAIHFAAQLVADGYYGGETDNEIFFLYPSDFIASQYDIAFNGWEKDLTQPQSETKWNDVFVWSGALDTGIPVDAGIVFLPESTLVDPGTGSKYASEVKKVDGKEIRAMMEDVELVEVFVGWAEWLTDNSLVIQALQEVDSEAFWYEKDQKMKICQELFVKDIEGLGFSSDCAVSIVSSLFGSSDGIHRFQYDGRIGFGDSKREAAINKLRSCNANWRRAENTVSAREYWERYFDQHPDQKPKHIVFYDWDPTRAIYEFQRVNNIDRADVSITEGKLLGFDDRHVGDMTTDSRAHVGYDELVSKSHRIIEEYYRNKQ